MTSEAGAGRRGVYRRRLALAAVASLALHALVARGLAVTRMALSSGTRPDAAADRTHKPKVKSDFAIRVPRSEPSRPVHERPLSMRVQLPETGRLVTPPDARPDRLTTTEQRHQACLT